MNIRNPVLSCLLLVGLNLGGSASAVSIDWVTVGDPGNACNLQSQGCFGAVDYTYRISQFEITKIQYVEFLNAVAASDPNRLYEGEMSTTIFGGIVREWEDGSYTYRLKTSAFAEKPADFVTFYDALRFANWMHNGQRAGSQDASTTEDGAYTITAAGIAANDIARNAGARIALASEDEWFKAAYYDTALGIYYDFPGGDLETVCSVPGPIRTPQTAHGSWEAP